MKRNKHITINLTDDQYLKIENLARAQRRTVADAAYIIIIDNLQNEILRACDLGGSIEKVKKEKRF